MAFPSQNVPGADGYKFPAPDLADWPETPETREILQRIKTIQRLLRFALVDFQYFWVVDSGIAALMFIVIFGDPTGLIHFFPSPEPEDGLKVLWIKVCLSTVRSNSRIRS